MKTDRAAARKDAGREDRKVLIAQAVIELLGTQGARGLTHRAVDAYLDLPPSSTSSYFRNKADLLMAGFQELVQPQRSQTEDFTELLFSDAFAGDPIRVIVEKEYKAFGISISEAEQPRVLARYEFFLMASRNPELRSLQESVMRRSFMADIVAFTRAGAKNPCRAAAEIGDLRRGIITTFCLVPSGRWGRELDLAYFERKIVSIIRETDGFEEDLQRL